MHAEKFQSVYAKMAWARGHFQTLDAEINAWLSDPGHRIVYERNEDLTQHYLRAEFGSKPRHDRWPLMIGDCVTNLRDTLDHTIYAIAHLPGSPSPTRADSAAFPITRSPDKFREAKGRLASVPEAIQDAVFNFQPFNRPHASLPPLLSVLSELANGSKHRLLRVSLTRPETLNLHFESKSGVRQPSATTGLHRQGILEGQPFFVLETPVPDPDLRLQPGSVIAFNVAIAHSPVIGDTSFDAGHTSYRPLLEQLFEEVEHIINTLLALV